MDAPRNELSKETVMAVHSRGYSARQQASGLGLHVSNLSVREPVPPSSSMQGLLPIFLSDLKVGKVHHGRVLMGTLCADAFIMTSIATVLQDEKDSSLAARIAIYNAVPPFSSIASVQKLYPKNTRVAIKEPYLKRAADGLLAIRVDNPANVEKVRVGADKKQSKTCASAHGGDGPLQLKEKGNGFFGKQDWKAAIDCYSKCISSVLQNDKEKKENASVLLAAYSNRAEAWMKLGSHEQALQDSESALAIDSHHTKSHYRKGRALHGLMRFQEAEACLQGLLLEHPELKDVRASLDTVKESLNRTPGKIVGLADYLLHKKTIPKFSDYVGPVVVRQTEDGRGRGLFTTARVRPGDLLVASNALAFTAQAVKGPQGYQDSGTNKIIMACQEDLVNELVRRGRESPSFLRRVYNLASFSGAGMEVPSMGLFTNTVDKVEQGHNVEVDVARIRKIVKINGFNQEPMSRDVCCAGIWLLPSFLNHSCLPNASRLNVGKGMVIHAAAEIQAGEEITFPYFNPMFPLEQRRTRAQAWDFWCVCKRCQVEKSAEKDLQDLNKEFDCVFNEAQDQYALALERSIDFSSNAALMAACKELSKLYKRIATRVCSLATLSGLEKKWVLTSYSSAFLAVWFREWGKKDPLSFKVSSGTALEVMEAVMACVPGCAWNWSFMIKLEFLARLQESANAGYLRERAADECIRAFGKMKSDVIWQLMEKDLDAIPSVFIN